jgi:hypothetical protein
LLAGLLGWVEQLVSKTQLGLSPIEFQLVFFFSSRTAWQSSIDVANNVYPVEAIFINEGYKGHASRWDKIRGKQMPFNLPYRHYTGNDISLIRVARPVNLDVYSPACLPPPNKDFGLHDSQTWNNKPWTEFYDELFKPEPDNIQMATLLGWGNWAQLNKTGDLPTFPNKPNRYLKERQVK